MAFILSQSSKVRYSPGEQALFQIIKSRRNGWEVGELASRFYDDGREPYHSRAAINGLVNSLMRKVIKNNEQFRVRRSPRQGPHPTIITVDAL